MHVTFPITILILMKGQKNMKIFKQITSIVMAVAMVATIIAVNPVDASAKVTIKSGKKIALTVGKKTTIKVKQKGAKFTSSNKKIATVTKKGKVTAKRPGACKIVVKVGKSKKSVPVTVTPPNITIDKAKNASDKGIEVMWEKSGNRYITGYYVYYSTNAKSGFKSVKVGNVSRTKIDNLTVGKTYYFKVKAYSKVGKKIYTSAKYSGVVSDKVRKMVWNDEFKGTKLDTTKWNNNGATGAGGYGNKELQNYQMRFSEVKDGNLIIKPQFEYNPETKSCVPNRYYSTKIWTKDMYSLKYGKVEFRAKLPKGQGTWAAGWMLGYGKWPMCGEIDVFESTKDESKTTIPQSIHCQRFNGMPTSSGNKYKNAIVKDATSAYHTYGIVWTPDSVTFTLDGKITWTYDPDMYVATGKGVNVPAIWPYNKDFYLIINCAIGGVLGGDVTPKYWTKINEYNTNSGIRQTYQDYMYVDYVRVYQ